MPREQPADKLLSSGQMDYDRRKESDRHRYRERSPRYRDRSSERSANDRYRNTRNRDRSRTRNTDRHRSSSRSRRSTSRTRHRSRSPRRQHYSSIKSSRHYTSSSSKIRSHRSRSNSSSSGSSRSRERSKHRSPRHDSASELKKESSSSSNSQVHVYTSEELQQISHRNKTAAADMAAQCPSASHSLYPGSNKWTAADQAHAAHLAESYDETLDEPIDKERIHREMEEKLRLALAKEGKVYPPPKPEPSHPVFANDGSFLEIFKKMQQQMPQQQHQPAMAETAEHKTKNQPICKRRGGKILKTGIVAKSRAQESGSNVDPKDFWSIYLQEVKKYKNTSCDVDSKTRPLVK